MQLETREMMFSSLWKDLHVAFWDAFCSIKSLKFKRMTKLKLTEFFSHESDPSKLVKYHMFYSVHFSVSECSTDKHSSLALL